MTNKKAFNHFMTNQSGIGLRYPHYEFVLSTKPKVSWLEVHSENFFQPNSIASSQLQKIAQDYPLSFHGVGLSLGSAEPLSKLHLVQLKNMVDIYNPMFVSEHLSWGAIDGLHFNDLLPLPYTQESLDNFCNKVKQTQDYLGRQILIENPSSYIEFKDSDIPEWEFYASLPNLTGCGLLFDVNNIVVNGFNHSFDPNHYINAVNPNDVQEIHLAGAHFNSFNNQKIMIDNHGSRVSNKVWAYYQKVLKTFGNKPSLIEWDTNIPEFNVLQEESDKAQNYLDANLCN